MRVILILLAGSICTGAIPLSVTTKYPTLQMPKRDVIGLLGNSQEGPDTMPAPVRSPPSINLPTNRLGSVITGNPSKTSSTASTLHATYSIIGSMKIHTAGLGAAPTTTTAATSTAESTPTPAPTSQAGLSKQASATPPGDATEWKVIGVAVISITVVATVILSVIFFDSWWGFLRAMLGGRKKSNGAERLVPDWEKRSWEFKLASEDGHRYPSLSSLEAITKQQSPFGDEVDEKHGNTYPHMCYTSPVPPEAIYAPGGITHGVLGRQPSFRNS